MLRIKGSKLQRTSNGLPPVRRSAFTLIELVAVMTILVVVSLIVVAPTMSYISDIRSSTACARLSADIRYLQRVALGSGLRTWLEVDDANDSYSLYVEDPNNLGKNNRVALVHPLDLSTNAISFGSGAFAGVTINTVDFNSTDELEFDSFGIPYDGNGVALTAFGHVLLSNSVAIKVYPVGGFVEHTSWP